MKKIITTLLAITMLFSNIAFAEDSLQSRYNALSDKLSQIKALVSSVDQRGIAADYEKVSYRVIEKFIDYGLLDIENGKTERAEYIADCLETMADETITNLSALRSGTAKPISIDRYSTSDVELDGYSVIADVQNNITGETERKPVLFTGYGHFGTVANDVEILKDLGANIIQQEMVFNECLVDPSNTPVEGLMTTTVGMSTQAEYAENEGINSSGCVHFVNTAEVKSGKFTQYTQKMPCEPSTTYTVSVYSKGNTNGLVYFRTDGWGGTQGSLPGGDDYTKTEVTFTTGENQHTMTFMLVVNGASDFCIDNVSYIANGKEYMHNGDFEKKLTTYENSGVTFGVDPTPAIIMADTLRRAELSDVKVDVLLSPHYFPAFLRTSLADMPHTGTGIEWMGGANIYHDLTIAAMKAYINEILPYFKDYKSLNGICIANEPGYTTKNSSEYYTDEWQAFLEKKYGEDIDTLNDAYGKWVLTKYSNFASVPMTNNESSKSPEYADWREFNSQMFAEWHKTMADEITKVLPDIPIHTKTMNYLMYSDNQAYNRQHKDLGTDAEKFDVFSDFHGNDAHSYYNVSWAPFAGELLWYDHLATVSEKPIFNSEDHIIADKNKDYTDNQRKHMRANLWQGAIHGRTLQTTWVYQRTYDETSLLSDSILDRPDVLEEAGHTNLDIARLSEEITALQHQTPEIAVYFSDTTRNFNYDHIEVLLEAYKDAIATGKRVSVLTDDQIESGRLTSDYKILIMPEVSNVSEAVVAKIASYIENGGSVVLNGDNLQKDNWNKTLSSEQATYIKDNSVTTDTVFDTINNILDSKDSDRIKVVDAQTGEYIPDTDFRVLEHNGNTYVSICRLDDINSEVKSIKILKGDEELVIVDDVLNTDDTSIDSLLPFEPRLLTVSSTMSEVDYSIQITDKSSESVTAGGFKFTASAKNTTDVEDRLTLTASICDSNGNVLKDTSFTKNVKSGKTIKMTSSFEIPDDSAYLLITVTDGNGAVSEYSLTVE